MRKPRQDLGDQRFALRVVAETDEIASDWRKQVGVFIRPRRSNKCRLSLTLYPFAVGKQRFLLARKNFTFRLLIAD